MKKNIMKVDITKTSKSNNRILPSYYEMVFQTEQYLSGDYLDFDGDDEYLYRKLLIVLTLEDYITEAWKFREPEITTKGVNFKVDAILHTGYVKVCMDKNDTYSIYLYDKEGQHIQTDNLEKVYRRDVEYINLIDTVNLLVNGRVF